MLPSGLTAAHFATYPPGARAVAVAHVPLLRQLPLAFLSSLLRELIEYDYKFPAERTGLDGQLAYLESLSPPDLARCFALFAKLRVTPEQTAQPWCTHPLDFTEQFSAYLWSTQQMDAFRAAASAYAAELHAALTPPPLPLPRLGIAVIGAGATVTPQTRLFSRLREHGTLFTDVDPQSGLQDLLAGVEARAQSHPAPFAHWYVDGGAAMEHSPTLSSISYAQLAPVRATLFKRMQKQIATAGMGPEQLRDSLGHLSPADLGLDNASLLDRFQVKLLTEGSGTQIFATTFAQWTAREVLRRAEALTLLVRFAPRQRQRPMNDLLAADAETPELDAQGSLVDADMAAFYQWINQQRLPGFRESMFLVWLEGQRQALAISPSLPRGTTSSSSVTLRSLLRVMST